MIRIDDVHKELGGQPILRGVSLNVAPGETVALVGPSGTGKSVLLRHVIGLLRPDAGDVRVGGISVPRAKSNALASLRARMGYVFQDGALLDALTVRENLRLAIYDDRCRHDPLYAANRIQYAIDVVRLPAGILEKKPDELSGGMRKRVGIARAIVRMPDILLFDEPTTGLDPCNVAAINELIIRARDALGATSIVVTHDLRSLPEVADRVVLLSGGTVCFQGSTAEFIGSDMPSVRAFTGTAGRVPELEEPWPTIRMATT